MGIPTTARLHAESPSGLRFLFDPIRGEWIVAAPFSDDVLDRWTSTHTDALKASDYPANIRPTGSRLTPKAERAAFELFRERVRVGAMPALHKGYAPRRGALCLVTRETKVRMQRGPASTIVGSEWAIIDGVSDGEVSRVRMVRRGVVDDHAIVVGRKGARSSFRVGAALTIRPVPTWLVPDPGFTVQVLHAADPTPIRDEQDAALRVRLAVFGTVPTVVDTMAGR